MKSQNVTIQMKVAEHYFPIVLFITVIQGGSSFESVDEILKGNHSNESY